MRRLQKTRDLYSRRCICLLACFKRRARVQSARRTDAPRNVFQGLEVEVKVTLVSGLRRVQNSSKSSNVLRPPMACSLRVIQLGYVLPDMLRQFSCCEFQSVHSKTDGASSWECCSQFLNVALKDPMNATLTQAYTTTHLVWVKWLSSLD